MVVGGEKGSAAGGEQVVRATVPGKRLSPAELHAQRKAWGAEWGQAMKDIKRKHEGERV